VVHITVLGAPNCELCEQARSVLARVARDHAIAVEELSTEADAGRKLMIEHRMAFPPGVFIEGEPFSYGRLSERKLRRELARRTQR
jgi:hypothetical protein